MAVVVPQDYETAASLAALPLALQKACRPSRESETLMIAYNFCLPWTRPLRQCMAPVADGYAFGMRTGNTVHAMRNLLCHHVWLPFAMGKPLGPILEQCPKILSQMEELSQPEQATNLKMFWQMGSTSKGAVYLGAMYGWQGELLVFFDLESAANRALKDGDKFATLSPDVFHNMRGTFLQATALFAIARRTRKRKYRTHANKLAYRIKGWTTRGNPNVRNYNMALMAEQAALRKKDDLAEE
eukprot:scaffold20461_cov117-Cylindrotheca_fusiformis.AAC.9